MVLSRFSLFLTLVSTIETTFSRFHISGKTSFFNDSLKIIFRGIVIDSLQILMILTDKLPHPCASVGSRDFIISNMSFSVAWKEFILLFAL